MRTAVATLLVLLAAAPARAGADEDAAQQRALVLLRVLAYDHNLARRAGDAVTVIVLFTAQADASTREHAAMRSRLASLEKLRVAGLPLHVVSAELTDGEALVETLDSVRPAALYLCAGAASGVPVVARSTRAARVLTFGASDEYVRAGLSVGILSGTPRARVLVNLAAARAEGVAFDAGLLKLVEVVR